MKFTDIFIRRPVLATVISLMILVIGMRSLTSLPVLQFPRTENAVVTISTSYYGADADTVAGFITTPLENAVAQANGIDFMTSSSINGTSTITANLRLNYDYNKALTEISTQINAVRNQLPPQAQQPVMTVAVGQTLDAMYIGFSSDVLPQNDITDYLVRVVQPKLQALEGVQTAELRGAQNFALRAWLDPQKLAAYNLTATDVSNALAKNDYISGIGTTKGQMVQMNLTAATGLHSLDEFRQLIIKNDGGSLVRLQDVANVTLGAEDYESRVGFDGKKAVYVGIKVAPSANLLDVMKRVHALMPEITAQLPQGMHGEVVYDSTDFVTASITEVEHTLIEAVLIVSLVVFLFLGSPRAVIIPIIAIPLSLIGAFIFMLALGFSINLLTLLALVLAIGLVVDDAIIVVENVNRHIEEGKKPFDAAIQAARELGNPIIAMTIVLIAVYVPIGFQSGLTGALFTEFAFTLVGAVVISAIVALTLSPMMCARFFKPHGGSATESRFAAAVDQRFERLRAWYERRLRGSFDYRPVTYVFTGLVFVCIAALLMTANNELAPEEDQGIVMALESASPTATLQQRQMYAHKVYEIMKDYPETGHVFQIDSPGFSIAGMRLTPWGDRKRTAKDLVPILSRDLGQVAGLRSFVIQPPPLPGSRGAPMQFVITTTESFDRLNSVVENMLAEVRKSGLFMFADSDLKIDLPQATLVMDKDKIAQMGLTMNDVGGAMSSLMGGGYVNYFSFGARSYKVIPQIEQASRLNVDQMKDYTIRTSDGSSIPLSTVASFKMDVVPETLNHFQQMNAAIIQGMPLPFVPLGKAVAFMQDLAKRTLPSGYGVDYAGQSRQYVQESSGFIWTFAFAVIIIFLTLSAQYESFRDPLIILVSVPLSILGALIFITMCGVLGASLNIYTKVGLVTLMGLVSKHGILITEFANNLQKAGRSKRDAVVEAASLRLRPILMTTAAMVLGVTPLLFASGAGALSRFNMGLVIASGLFFGTLLTLFVVPAFYMLLATDRREKKA